METKKLDVEFDVDYLSAEEFAKLYKDLDVEASSIGSDYFTQPLDISSEDCQWYYNAE